MFDANGANYKNKFLRTTYEFRHMKNRKEANDNDFCRLNDAQAHLMRFEGSNYQDALQTVLELNSTQMVGMTDLGLLLEQVQHPYFTNTEGILTELLQHYRKGIERLPLEQGEWADMREVFDSRVTASVIDQVLGDAREDVQETEQAMIAGITGVTHELAALLTDDELRNEQEELINKAMEAMEVSKNTKIKRSDSLDSLEYSDDEKPAATRRIQETPSQAFGGQNTAVDHLRTESRRSLQNLARSPAARAPSNEVGSEQKRGVRKKNLRNYGRR